MEAKYPPKSFDLLKAYEDLKESATDFVLNAPNEPKNLILLLLIFMLFMVIVQWCFQALCSSSKPKRRRSTKTKSKTMVAEVAVQEDDKDDKDDKEE